MTEREAVIVDSPQRGARGPDWRHSRWTWLAGALAVVLIAVIVWRIVASSAGSGQGAEAPIPVAVASAREGRFVVYQSAPGTITPENTVLVRARVEGQLTAFAFKEGQMVTRGELLATLDPRAFKDQLELAAGKRASDQALLQNARHLLQRYRSLQAQDSISAQKVSDQQALVQQYQAAVQVDQGRVDVAKLQLAYTRITAPISGMAGLRQVNLGNFVGPSDPDGIVRITQLAPTSVVFAVPADQLGPLVRDMHGGTAPKVTVYGSDAATALGSGPLLATNNQVDPATGTVKLRAELANADRTLFPGQAVTVRVPLKTFDHATLVPSAAVQHGAAGPFVYVIKGGDVVAVAPVGLGPSDAGTTVIERGVVAGDEVVIEGMDRLRAGARVAPSAAPAAAAGSTPSSARAGGVGSAP